MEPGQRLWETWRAVMPAGPHSPPWEKLDADSQVRWASVEAALVPSLPADIAGLVERLDAGVEYMDEDDGGEANIQIANETMTEAAATIRAQAAEIERLREGKDKEWIEAAGMRVVPVEPSEKMIAAAWGAWKERHKDRIGPGPGFVEAITAALTAIEASHGPFKLGDRVRKTKGSSWHGRVVGFYSTSLTPVGYAVESEREPGSVQIYPVSALEPAQEGSTSE